MPTQFFIIIAAQFIVLLFFVLRNKGKRDGFSLLTITELSLVAGFIFGIFFDFVSGGLETHRYILPVPDPSVLCPCGLSAMQLLWNGALSYGLAVATAYFISPSIVEADRAMRIKLGVLALSILVISVWFLSVLQSGTLAIFFACGFMIVSLGELIMLLGGHVGPILSSFVTREITRLSRAWVAVIVIAIIYESVNGIFPFWEWLSEQGTTAAQVELVVIIFAYAGLFHPMIVFWQLARKRAPKS